MMKFVGVVSAALCQVTAAGVWRPNDSEHGQNENGALFETPLSGIIKVTDAPYNADPTGVRDSTSGIQSALIAARNTTATVLVPLGVYRVTSTINVTSFYEHDSVSLVGDIQGSAEGVAALDAAQDSLGYRHTRPVLWVPEHTPAFELQQYVVHLWRTDLPGEVNLHPNGNFNQVLQHVDVHVSLGNPGAIGVRHRAAQHSMIDNVTIVIEDSVGVGIQSLPGSGGVSRGVAVIGGHIGLDLRNTQPTTPVTNVTLLNQSCAAVVYSGQQSLVLVAANINVGVAATAAIAVPGGNATCTVALPDDPGVRPGPLRSEGQVVLVDGSVSRIEPTGQANHGAVKCTHVITDTSVVLRNTWLKGCGTAVTIVSPISTRPNPAAVTVSSAAEWSHVDTIAVGVEPAPTTPADQPGLNKTMQFHASISTPQLTSSDRIVNVSSSPEGPPPDLFDVHRSMADCASSSFRNRAGIDVTSHGAKGDGVNDDTPAFRSAIAAAAIMGSCPGCRGVVVIPAGTYLITDTLTLPDNAAVALAGVSLRQVTLIAAPTNASFNGPVIRTAGAPCVLRDLFISYFKHQRGAFGVDWRSTDVRSAMIQVRIDRSCVALASRNSDWCVPFQVNSTVPAMLWRGSGALYSFTPPNNAFKWSATNSSHTDISPQFRHLLFLGARDSRCYACDPEAPHSYIAMDAAIEVHKSSNVAFYGTKSEGANCVVWVHDSLNVAVYGHGGMGTPPPADYQLPSGFLPFVPSLFRVTNSTGVELASIVDRAVDPNSVPPSWNDAAAWVAVYWESTTGVSGRSGALDRPAWFQIP